MGSWLDSAARAQTKITETSLRFSYGDGGTADIDGSATLSDHDVLTQTESFALRDSYSIASSARPSSVSGKVSPSALAVFMEDAQQPSRPRLDCAGRWRLL